MAAAVVSPNSVLRARLARLATTRAQVAADDPAAAPLPAQPPASLERSAANAAARAADRAAGLVVIPDAVEARGITLAELPELLPEHALIAVIEAPGERLGVVALCPATVASLIEIQAIGHVTSRPVETRRATRADAAIAADFVNLLLEEFAETVAGLPGQAALRGFRYASYLDDPRPLGLMLDDSGFRALTVKLRIGPSGERRGCLFIAVPATSKCAEPAGNSAAALASCADNAAAGPPREAVAPVPPTAGAGLSQAMLSAPVALIGILCRRPISLREVRALKPGHVLTLPRDVLEACSIETPRGQKLATGKLGEQDGRHALRLRSAARRDGEAGTASPVTPLLDTTSVAVAQPHHNPATDPAMLQPTKSSLLDLSLEDEFRTSPSTGDAAILPMQMAFS